MDEVTDNWIFGTELGYGGSIVSDNADSERWVAKTLKFKSAGHLYQARKKKVLWTPSQGKVHCEESWSKINKIISLIFGNFERFDEANNQKLNSNFARYFLVNLSTWYKRWFWKCTTYKSVVLKILSEVQIQFFIPLI